jgi:toxin ParE1/3/4
MANYIVTPNAKVDIIEILNFIGSDNIDAAFSFQERLINLFETLADNPKMGKNRTELKPELRSFAQGNYLVFYREWAGIIAIVRVLHGARDIEEIFG